MGTEALTVLLASGLVIAPVVGVASKIRF